MPVVDSIPNSEFAQRRGKILATLKGAVGLLLAGDDDPHDGSFRPHAHFEYLTGIVDEAGAVMMLDPTHAVESRRTMLFLTPLNRERERWDGLRMEIS
ncbi:MAG: aminopeptidase P N-terminal domain-containing protein, partial [Nitrospirae bacterium]|nr:aminopeptidase P N-terminal domain-containing protein [Nitrospirota bacterium]